MRTMINALALTATVAASMISGVSPAGAMVEEGTSPASAPSHCYAGWFCVYEGVGYTGTRHLLPPGTSYKDIGSNRPVRSYSNNSDRKVCTIVWLDGKRYNSPIDDYREVYKTGSGWNADAIGDRCWE